MTREEAKKERLKMLMETGEFEFLKGIPSDTIWKLVFALGFIQNEEPCAEAISRQAVEEMIKTEMPERGMWEIEGDKEKETVCEVCVDLMQKLSELPPVNPQPKTGHWIKMFLTDTSDIDCQCSECGFIYKFMYDKCPNCGCRMKSEEISDRNKKMWEEIFKAESEE